MPLWLEGLATCRLLVDLERAQTEDKGKQLTQIAGFDARENQFDDHERELSSPGPQPSDRDHAHAIQ